MVLVERFLGFISSIIWRRSGVMTCSRVEEKGGAFIMADRKRGECGSGDHSSDLLSHRSPEVTIRSDARQAAVRPRSI